MVLLGTGRAFFHWADFLKQQYHYTKKSILVTVIRNYYLTTLLYISSHLMFLLRATVATGAGTAAEMSLT